MNKKLLALILAILCMFTVVACGAKTEETSDTSEAPEAGAAAAVTPLFINSEPYCVNASDCDDRGFAAYTCDATGNYKISVHNPEGEDIQWSVYLMDEMFEDSTRYIPESQEAALTGEGTLEIKEGQYIYVYCSANSFELGDEAIPDDAYLSFEYE